MLLAQPQWTPGPRQIEFRPTGQTKFVICDYTIEFIIRDAKQHLGLSQCQARDQAKLDFHLNASVAGVNLGRLASSRLSISLGSLLRESYNTYLGGRLLSELSLEAEFGLTDPVVVGVLRVGRIGRVAA